MSRWLGGLAGAAVVAVVVGGAFGIRALTSEGGGGTGGTAHGGRSATTQRLVDAADLSPCPNTTSQQALGDGLPDLTLPCLGDGPSVRLAGLRGTPYVLNVWAGPCPPCKREAPQFVRFHDAAGGRVGMLGVVYGPYPDTIDDALDASRGLGIRYPSVFDKDGALLRTVRSPGIPLTILVEPDGQIAHVKRGELGPGELAELVSTYLHVDVQIPGSTPSGKSAA